MLYNFIQGSRIPVLVLNELVCEHLKISISIHTLTHNMTHQKATRPLHRTSLMNRLIIKALSQESLVYPDWTITVHNYDYKGSY